MLDPSTESHSYHEEVFVKRGATVSRCGRYRFTLERAWCEGSGITWIMLNPSTADASVDDPTIRRVIRFSQRWGHGSLRVLNLSPLRTPRPRECLAHALPEEVRDHNLSLLSEVEGPILAAWGVWGARLLLRDAAQSSLLDTLPLQALGRTRDGHPLHPLARGRHRVPDDALPLPYTSQKETHTSRGSSSTRPAPMTSTRKRRSG